MMKTAVENRKWYAPLFNFHQLTALIDLFIVMIFIQFAHLCHCNYFFAQHVPEHACSYCGIVDTAAVLMCNVCNKWFCNGGNSNTGSHIINHLVRAKHKVEYLMEIYSIIMN